MAEARGNIPSGTLWAATVRSVSLIGKEMCWHLLHSQLFLCVQEFDGAARGNPGPAGAGAALFDDSRDMQVAVVTLANVLYKS